MQLGSRFCLIGLALVWVSCGGADPPEASVAPQPMWQPPPPAPPPLLVVPRAEASPRRAPAQKTTSVPALRSEGEHHALERTKDGIVLLSDERGVVGFLKSPAQGAAIRWAGFVDGDAVLVATADTLHRAATPDDAVAGTFQALGPLEPAATLLASAGKIVVAAATGESGALYESRDGGKRFTALKRPATGPIADVAVRTDGVIAVAIEKEPFQDAQGRKGIHADVYVRRGLWAAWNKGPLAETTYGRLFTHRGDSITVMSPGKPGDASSQKRLGLDEKGKWIPAGYPGHWLASTSTSTYIGVAVAVPRPGFPLPPDNAGGLLGLLGGRMEGDCRGFDCLGNRSPLGAAPHVGAFEDGQCDTAHVITRTEQVDVVEGQGKAEQSHTWQECDPSAPIQRPSTLLLRDGEQKRLMRLPSWCAAGRIVGTDRAAFVYCSAKHHGRPSIHRVSPEGTLAEVASSMPDELQWYGAESVSDGTTVLFADKGVWVCRPQAPCASVAHDGFLAARPLPAGRALIARRGANPSEGVLELFGEAGAAPIRVSPPANALEMEVTPEGYVRLWISATLRRFEAPESLAKRSDGARIDAVLVRADGQLVAELPAKQGP